MTYPISMNSPSHGSLGIVIARRQIGFTLVELMVAIAIVAILAALATPSFQSMIINNRISAQANTFVGSINVARSEAVKRGHGVSLCASSDGATCSGGSSFGRGWIVFDDADGNQTMGEGDSVLFAYPALASGSTAEFSAAANLTFIGTGRPIAAFSGAVGTLCPPEGGGFCRYICINSMGRPRVSRTLDGNCGN